MIVVDNGEQGWHGGKIMVWWFPLQQLDDSTSDTPDIRSRSGAGKLYDLRGHPVWRAYDLCLLVWSGKSACRNAEIGQLDGAILGRQDIGSFDVSMDNTLVVQILQTLKDLGHVHTNQVLGKLAISFANGMQRAIFTVSARRISVRGGLGAVRGTYSRMILRQSAVLTKPIYFTILSC